MYENVSNLVPMIIEKMLLYEPIGQIHSIKFILQIIPWPNWSFHERILIPIR